MNRLGWCVVAVLALLASACAKKEAPSSSGSTTPAPATVASSLDDGPRAADSPADKALAEQGEQLFKDKGCSACHAFGRKLTCPDLAGVTHRRTVKWMEAQILHPDKMTKEDPIARQLFAQFMLQMPNQGLTEAQAQAVIEYFKHKDRESAGAGS